MIVVFADIIKIIMLSTSTDTLCISERREEKEEGLEKGRGSAVNVK